MTAPKVAHPSLDEIKRADKKARAKLRAEHPKLVAMHDDLVSEASLYCLEKWGADGYERRVAWKAAKLALDAERRQARERMPARSRVSRPATLSGLKAEVRANCREQIEKATGRPFPTSFDIGAIHEIEGDHSKAARAILKQIDLVPTLADHVDTDALRELTRHPRCYVAEWHGFGRTMKERAVLSLVLGNWPPSAKPGLTVNQVIRKETAALRAEEHRGGGPQPLDEPEIVISEDDLCDCGHTAGSHEGMLFECSACDCAEVRTD